MITRNQAAKTVTERLRNSNESQTGKASENKSKSPKVTEKRTMEEKMEELHKLLVSMSDKFQSKMTEISTTFQKELTHTKEEVNMDMGEENNKVLGLYWSLKPDCFKFKTNVNRIKDEIIQMKRAPTKREVLSIVMSLFDPFGFLGNYTINGKLLLQSIWKEGIQ